MNHKIFTTSLTALALLAGCGKYEENKTQISAKAEGLVERLQEIREPATRDNRTSNVRITDGIWVGSKIKSVPTRHLLPPELEGEDGFVISTVNVPDFSELVYTITEATGLQVRLAPELGDDVTVNFPSNGLFYAGPMSRFLDSIASSANINWSYDVENQTVEFYEFVTRAFRVHALDNSGSSSTSVGAVSYSGSVDLWSEIVDGVEALAGEDSEIEESASSGYLIVTAPPRQMRLVREFIEEQNAERLRQVVINVAVFLVSITDEQSVGIDLTLAFARLNSTVKLGTSGVGRAAAGTSGTFQVLPGIASKPGRYLAGSEITAAALGTLGNVSTVTSATLTTLNDQPVPLQISSQTTYISGAGITTEGTGTDRIATTTVSTATADDTIDMVVRPRVLPDNRVRLEFQLNVQELVATRTYQTTGGETITLPETSSRSFLNQVVLRNGSTLILSGYERTKDEAERTGATPALWVLGGSSTGRDSRELSVVTIQPIVLEDTGLIEVPVSGIQG